MDVVLAPDSPLAMRPALTYIGIMHPDPELKRLHWRAHHRGIREADMLIGVFFDAHHASWSDAERAQFSAMLDEQDADLLAWARGTAAAPERYRGPVLEALKQLNYIPAVK